ncbi:myosin-13-like isoform X5 [Lytechinus variegatus]|uniref:myosin-13-like isoform X5 n=1 Tax=Lytechinus variegatus TaxID=7654 RepID=UPI001BB16CCB|nr:myosin-13-like isoform X5 [Lytechinus variegatus]
MDEVPEEFGVRQWSPSMVGTMSVLDRGDAPAQLVIERNLKAQAQRQADQTKEELDRITSRVNKTVAAFELNEEMMDENKAAYFVPDLLELEKIISDTIQKRRYQQQVMIFVVGFEEVTDQRLKLLNQINDFFGTYINSVDEEEFKPKKPEVDLEEVSVAVKDALDTASSATQKLSDINTEILSYVEKMTGGKAASKSKKKLEKALQQAKDDIMSLTDKLQGAQADIEDKEDQMTRLYKQIDLKSMEVMKYKNAAEQAKKKLDQISELQLEISERDEEIERLNKALDDSQLSLKQLENSKENSFARLKAANDEGENKNQTIEKLQRKIQALNVQLGDSWNDSQKQFESTLQQVNEEHRQELESIRETLQARIDELEEEALNQPKGWASDSEDERDLTKSLSRTSGYLDHGPEFEMTEVASNVTSLSQPREPGWDLDTLGDDREIKSGLSSRQPSSIRKQELQSRQSTDAAIKPTPPGTPKNLDPPKPKNINKVIEDDSSRNKTGTPKKAMRTKSNLEPVHEVPFEEKIPLEEEERWSKVPQEQLPSAFKQYRKEALFIVQGLQEKIKTNQEDNHKKIKQLRNHIQVKEEKWDKERNTLVHQVDAAREAEREAEKEADSAVAQLESFVKEHEETTKNAIKQEQKALKTLTPEQRAKYLGEFNPMEMVKPIKEEKNPEHMELFMKLQSTGRLRKMPTILQEELAAATEGNHKLQQALLKVTSEVADDVGVGGGILESAGSAGRIDDGEGNVPSIPPLPLDDFLMVEPSIESGISVDGEDELDRPLSASSHHSQQSLYEKFRAQLEQRKQEIVERRSRATSMHGSLLSAKSGSYRDQAPSRDSSAVLTPQGDIQFPDEEYEDPGEVLKSSAESSTRPHPQREQQSAAISHQDQMSQARLSTAGYQGRVSSHLVSRAPSVSESGVSMLETDEEGGYSADEEEAVAEALPRFIATATSAKLFDVDKLDMATSPVAYSTVSKSSRQSIESIADHPVVQDYLKTYQHITDFKENVMKLVYDKEFGAALEQLAEIKTLQFDRDSNVQSQVSHMTYNVETFLKEIISVFGTVMTTPEPEAAISSLMVSRADTGKSRMGGLGFQLQSAAEAIQEGVQEGLEREMTDMTFQSSERIKEIQENYDRLKQEASKQQMDYEDKLNNNTVMMMEMQNTIQDLQQELQALGGSKAMSSPSRVSTATANRDLQVEPTIIFSRSDSERNQRALKRGISAQKVSAEQYNEAVRAMEQYTVLPAKRLVHIVRKYSHHTEMKKIEDDVRRSNSIDQEVYTLLERMETLQSKRAQRWGEEMDNLTAERNRLAHLLMDTLTHLEQESGIFMIKPILSWKGRGFQPHYQSKLSSYQPPKRLLRPITPEERKGTPFTVVPAPTPANQGTKAGYRPGTRTSSGTPGGGDAHRLYTSGHIPNGGASLKGSAVQMVGEVPQPMWSMNTSIPTQGGEGTGTVGGGLTGRLNFMTTPRLLELDVNRLLIGQNTVSAATKALLSNDRLVNAANSSVRSYVTIARPSTHPPVPNLRPSRPNSSSEAEKGQTTPRSPPPQTSSSAGPHGRSRSEGALQMSQPLPPIKVPSNNNEEDDNRTGKDTGESNSQSRLHPSPPHTPPGSSLRHSPAIIDDDDDPRQSQNASPGHITKVSMRSASRSSEHNLKM